MSSSSPSPSPSPPAASEQLVNFTHTYVKAWGSFLQSFALPKGHSCTWEWKTQAHDLQFSATFEPHELQPASSSSSKKKLTGPAVVVQPETRVAKAAVLLSHGRFIAQSSGTLTLKWDNSYSKLRGKNLLWKTVVAAPDEDANAIAFGETVQTSYGSAVIQGLRDVDGIYAVQLPYGFGYFNLSTLLAGTVAQPPKSINQRCLVGVELFFNNRVWEAEAFFRREVEKFPVFSLAHGCICFLKALMTWDKADIQRANERLKQGRNLVCALLPAESTLSSMGRFLSRSSKPKLDPLQLEYTLLQAEAYLLQAMLLFTEESYMAYIKAGLKIRSAWKLYQRCDETIDGYDAATLKSLDPSVIGGIKLGIGCFNVIISILPSIILRLVSAMGFPSDRTLGLKLLGECAAVPSVRQPLSSLMLLFVHVVIPSFFTVRPSHHISQASIILTRCFQQFPEGALFRWMEGRLNRMRRNLPAAVFSFKRSAAGQPHWIQLQHLCAYELGWCEFFQLDFPEAEKYWERLENESSWSRAFFVYMRGASLLSYVPAACGERLSTESEQAFRARVEAKQIELATPCMSKVEPSIIRKFGGKIISVEQFVSGRSAQFLAEQRKPLLPALEMIYLFYGFIQMHDALLVQCLHQVETILVERGDSLEAQEYHLVQLIRAAIFKALRRWNDAKAILKELDPEAAKIDSKASASSSSAASSPPAMFVDSNSSSSDSDMVDRYLPAFTRFEYGSLLMEQVVEKDAWIAALQKGEQLEDAQKCSLDQAVPITARNKFTDVTSKRAFDASPVNPNRLATILNGWESERLVILQQAHTILKKCEGFKFDYCFKNRLHMRLHLACVEIVLLKQKWKDIQGNVQNDADLKPDEEMERERERATRAAAASKTTAENDPCECDSDEDIDEDEAE